MKIKKYIFILPVYLLSIQFSTSFSLAKGTKVENFVFYSVQGERNIFYKILESLPKNGMIILNFTSTTCIPCKKEIPELLKITKKSKHRVKLICIYPETGKVVKQSAGALKNLQNAYVDPFGILKKNFDIKKIPVTIIVNKRREIKGRFEGYTKKNIITIRKLVTP